MPENSEDEIQYTAEQLAEDDKREKKAKQDMADHAKAKAAASKSAKPKHSTRKSEE